ERYRRSRRGAVSTSMGYRGWKTRNDLNQSHINPWRSSYLELSGDRCHAARKLIARSCFVATTLVELEFDDRSARDEAASFLERCDDLFDINGLPGVPCSFGISHDRKRARITRPLVLNAMRVARSRRSHSLAKVEKRKPIFHHALGELAP